MKKNILIIVLSILALFSLLYAFIKADEAAKAAEEARIAEQYLEEQIDLADKQAELAIRSAAEAKAAKMDAARMLADCKSSK